MGAIAGAVTLGRFFTRWRYSRLGWDDLFNGLALACLGTYVALPATTDPTTPVDWKIGLASLSLFWTTLWCAKASFLALCWIIFRVSTTFRKAWWAVTIYTVLTYCPVLIRNLWQCGNPLNHANPTICLDSLRENVPIAFDGVIMACHISSEILILGTWIGLL